MVESGNVTLTAALARVRPLCMQVVQMPSASAIRAISTEMKALESEVLEELQQFLVFPLRCTLAQCLTKSMPQQVLCDTCEALVILASRTKLHHSNIVFDLVGLLSDILLSVSPVGHNKRQLVEEEQSAVVKTICRLFANQESSTSILLEIYSAHNCARLGGLVSSLVSLVSAPKATRDLHLTAMEGLLVLMQKNTKFGTSKQGLLGNRFAGLLPGISTSMLKVLIGDSKQGQRIFCKALEVWTEVVCLTLADQSLKEVRSCDDNLHVSDRLKDLVVSRNEKWTESVVPRVEYMAKEITVLKKHESWKVRLSLVEWAQRLLTECKQSLKVCIPTILEVLISLLSDSYSQVATRAKNVLQSFNESYNDTNECRPLIEMLKENLLTLVTSLPRKIKMEDEEEKVVAIKLLNGYITILGNNMSALLLSLPHVTRLARVLVQSLEIDCSDQKILEETGMGTCTSTSTNLTQFVQRATVMKPRKRFVHFQNDEVKSRFLETCRLLAKYGDLNILVECFLDIYHESPVQRLACVLIMNEILAGVQADTSNATVKMEIVRMLLDEYLSPVNMVLTDSSTSSFSASSVSKSPALLPLYSSSFSTSLVLSDESPSHTSLNQNRMIMLICLYLEGVGMFAKTLGDDFKPLLMEVLYPLAEKVGSEISSISGTAYLALMDICAACGYNNIGELIQSNADYLVNSISLKLLRFQHHQRAPCVLSVMLQFCNSSILPLVWDSILEILDTLDEHHVDYAMLFMHVLHQLTLAIARWFPPQTQRKNQCSRVQHENYQQLDPHKITEFLLNRHRQRLEAENYDDDITDDSTKIEEDADKMLEEERKNAEEEEEKKAEPPLQVKAVKEVLTRVKHLLASSDPRLSLLALDVMAQSCADLADYENELLPMVHQLWAPFSQRFFDGEKLIIIKAVTTLHTLCSLCGDFIQSRVVKGILPSLQSFLRKQAIVSRGSSTQYSFTINYKLQLKLLSSLGYIAQMVAEKCTAVCEKFQSLMMGIGGTNLEDVVHCCLPYLSKHQPIKLQEACRDSMKQLISCDADLLWLLLCDLYNPSVLMPPSYHFISFKEFSAVGASNEFTDNVCILLDYLSSHCNYRCV